MPSGYREHLEILQETLGQKGAPYFGPNLEYPREGRSIWEGHRGIEEYAREVFPIEEYNNGLRWMDGEGSVAGDHGGEMNGSFEDGGDGAERATGSRPQTPANHGSAVPLHVSAMTPHSHPESGGRNFFVGSC